MRLGNGSILKATGKGTIQVPLEAGDKHIHDVLLVPGLDQNLLSVGQLIKRGHILLFAGDSCATTGPDGDLLMEVPMVNNSFLVNFNSTLSLTCKASVD